jgi:predicted nuclease with TOPRIM domain
MQMTDKQIINSCEFQSRCIEYKDMYSYKHIKCPIVDFAIACRGENKCKYKTVYEQLKAKEQECEELKEQLAEMISQAALLPKFFGLTADEITNMLNQLDQLKAENKYLNDLLNQALKELEELQEGLENG